MRRHKNGISYNEQRRKPIVKIATSCYREAIAAQFKHRCLEVTPPSLHGKAALPIPLTFRPLRPVGITEINTSAYLTCREGSSCAEPTEQYLTYNEQGRIRRITFSKSVNVTPVLKRYSHGINKLFERNKNE